MSRKEAVLLVSRALAVMQFAYAMIEITYLPIRVMSLAHHARRLSVLGESAYDAFWQSYYRTDIAFLLLRVLFLLLVTVVLWNCGPWIERVLLPRREEPDQPA
jgi:hypothetical protein